MTCCGNALVDYTSDGEQLRYSFPFEYIEPSEVEVLTWNEETNNWDALTYDTDWVFVNATTIELKEAVPVNYEDPLRATVRIMRCTNLDSMSQFQRGSNIRADDLNDNFDKAKLGIEELRSRICALQEDQADSEQDIEDLEDRVEDLEDRVDKLEDRVDGHDQDIENINKDIEDINKEIDNIKNEIDDLRDDLKGEIDDLRDDLQDQIDAIQNGGSLDYRYVKKTGDRMTGVLRMDVNQIKEVQDPTHDLDAVNLRTLKLYLGIDPDDPDPDDDIYSFERVDLTANGGESSIDSTLTLNANREFVYLNGVLISPDIDYSVNGDTIDLIGSTLIKGDRISIVNFTIESEISRENITVIPNQKRYVSSLMVDHGDLNVTLNGVMLLPSDIDYGLTNPVTIVFNQAPFAGDILRVYNADCQRTHNIADSGDVLFGVSESNAFTAGEELVFLNGKLLIPTDDYTVSSGRFINLSQPANGGDSVLIITP